MVLINIYYCIRTEYKKIRTRNNSVFGHFSHSVTTGYFTLARTISLLPQEKLRLNHLRVLLSFSLVPLSCELSSVFSLRIPLATNSDKLRDSTRSFPKVLLFFFAMLFLFTVKAWFFNHEKWYNKLWDKRGGITFTIHILVR